MIRMVQRHRLLDNHDWNAIANRVGQFVGLADQITVTQALFELAFTNWANQHVNQMSVQLLSPVGGLTLGAM